MTPAIAILGGSTPFTAALVEALREASSALPACELRLFGRDRTALVRMARYGRGRLADFGWTVTATVELAAAATDATVVINQMRFGGLEGRAADEALAARFRVAADETLGPCGLLSALRAAPPLREVAAELGRLCPGAWVLNLANPLSVMTGAMVQAGAPRRCVGLCELPMATVREACRVIGISAEEVCWSYVGLNHRGFVFSLAHQGEELMPQLPDLVGNRRIFGVGADTIRHLGALPLKYFPLSTGAAPGTPSRRAEFLRELKSVLARELDGCVAPPAALSRRDLSWYRDAVVPMVDAIFRDDGRALVVNALSEDGLVRETHARVWRDRLSVMSATPPAPLLGWLARWEAHERALVAAVERPTPATLEAALEADPSVPRACVRDLAREVERAHAT